MLLHGGTIGGRASIRESIFDLFEMAFNEPLRLYPDRHPTTITRCICEPFIDQRRNRCTQTRANLHTIPQKTALKATFPKIIHLAPETCFLDVRAGKLAQRVKIRNLEQGMKQMKYTGLRVTLPERISTGGYFAPGNPRQGKEQFDGDQGREYRFTCATSKHTYTIWMPERYDEDGTPQLNGLPRHKDGRFLLFALASIQGDQVLTGNRKLCTKRFLWRELVEGAGLTYCGENKSRAELAMKRYSESRISITTKDDEPLMDGDISWKRMTIITTEPSKNEITVSIAPSYLALCNMEKAPRRFLCLAHFNSMTALESRLFEMIQSRLRYNGAASFWTTPEKVWETVYGNGYKHPRRSNIVNRLRRALDGIARKTQSDGYQYRVELEKNGYGRTQKIRFVLRAEPDVWNYIPESPNPTPPAPVTQSIDEGLDDFDFNFNIAPTSDIPF